MTRDSGPSPAFDRRRFQRRPNATSAGFTMIELLVVMALMVILAAAAAPSFWNLAATSRLRGAARGLASQCRYARDVAVNRGTYVRVALDVDNGASAVLVLEEREDQRLDSTAYGGRLERDLAPRDWEATEWVASGTNLGRPKRLPDGVFFERMLSKQPDGEPAVTFSPDGRAEDWFIVIADNRDQQLAVHVRGVTGRIQVLSPEDRETFESLLAQTEGAL